MLWTLTTVNRGVASVVSREMQFLGGNTWNAPGVIEWLRRVVKEFPIISLKPNTPNVSNALSPRKGYGGYQ